MKALSIQQPWAWAICAGYKPIENRDWNTNFRGQFLIHAGKKVDRDSIEIVVRMVAYQTGRTDAAVLAEYERAVQTGGIVGEARMVDVITSSDSQWFQGRFGFVLHDALPLPFVPTRGMLGFFDVPEVPK